jgi:hypothetical protein
MNTLRKLFARLFWRHQWDIIVRVDGNPATRTCAVCGRVENLLDDGWGPQWVMDKAGDAGKHHGGGK